MRIIFVVLLGLLPIVTLAELPLEIAQKGASAYAAERYEEAADHFERLVLAVPWSPGARTQAARSLARAGREEKALEHLGIVVDLGVRFDPSDAAWESIRSRPEFERLASRMRARTAPLIRSSVAFRLEKKLIPENIAFDPTTGAFFVGSMYKAKILRIAPDGTVSDFVPSRRDGLLSVLGMKIDSARRELWAVSGNFGDRPPLEIADPESVGTGALFRFDLGSGRLLAKYPAPGGNAGAPVQFNDLVLTPDGDAYLTAGPRGIWRLRRSAGEFEEIFALPGSFFNGIAIAPDGKTIFAASHLEGVFRIDPATKSSSRIELPPAVTLGGIDGLYVHDGSLVAIQNGTDPMRVIRAWLDPSMMRVTRFAVLEQEHPESDFPLTGTIVGEELYYIARSQLRAFDDGTIWPDERLKETTVLRLPLEMAVAPAPDLTAEHESLLAIHRDEIRAHLERDAEALAAGQSEELVMATQGKIRRSTPEETRAFFARYFDGVSYLEYVDAEPPVIRISDDGSMGWILSRTRVRFTREGAERGFVYAGIMIYQKRNGRWLRVANASTFE